MFNKKGDVQSPLNYRSIAPANSVSKIFFTFIAKDLKAINSQNNLEYLDKYFYHIYRNINSLTKNKHFFIYTMNIKIVIIMMMFY